MPRLARLYLILLTLAAVSLLAWWLTRWEEWPLPSFALIVTLLILAVAAQHFPLEIAPGYKVTASSAAYFAALLAIGPPAALALIVAAQLLGGLGLFLRRDGATGRRLRGPAGILFNAAQYVIAFGLGGLVTAATLPPRIPVAFDARLALWAISAAAIIHLANTGAVAVMVGLQRRRPIMSLWWAGQRAALPEAIGLFTLGLAMALLAGASALAPVLLVPSLALLHWSLVHARRLREEATRSAAELRATLEAIEQGVLLTDTSGRVRYANRRLGTLLGVDIESLPGRRWADIVGEMVAPRLVDSRGSPTSLERNTAANAPPERGELGIRGDEARTLVYYRGPVHDPDGAPTGRVEVYEDVSAARRLARARQEFLMVASHELKTPLTTLGGYLELLERQLTRPSPPDPARLAHHVAIAKDEWARLRRLSDDLIAAAQLRTGHLSVARVPLDLAEMVRRAVERYVVPRNVAARGHRITCRVDGPLQGEFDAARIEQVLTNLLGNALKYSPNGGEVVVTARRADDQARITVRDHGIGVADEEREKLFQPFYRADNAGQGSPEGLGLGLAISRDIVEAHGGRLWVEAAPDGGSLFHLALPLADRKSLASQPPEWVVQPPATAANETISCQQSE